MTKKSFILYVDSLSALDELDDAQAGQLFKAIKLYNETGNVQLSGVLKALFINFKNQMDRDCERYDAICKRNKNNALSRWKEEITSRIQSHPVGTSGYQIVPKHAHSDSDNDNDNDKGSKKEKINKGSSKKMTLTEWELKRGKLETHDLTSVCKKYGIAVSDLPILIEEFRLACAQYNYKYEHFDIAFRRWGWERTIDFIKKKRNQSPSYLL